MANNYDDYGYDDDNQKENSSLSKKLVIVILVIIAIILIIFLLSSCGNGNVDKNKNNKKTSFDYESALLEAGKNYFRNNVDETPTAPGECNVVDLERLISKGLVNAGNFGNCNVTTTYVRMCILENKTKHYTPWLTCTDKNSSSEYAELTPGTLNDIIVDKTYTEFKFLPQVLNAEGNLGPVEEIWKDEIKYSSYKTLGTTTYYRYRDMLYTWNVTSRKYYTSTGEKDNASSVTEYYATSPASGYTSHDSMTTEAYKWYTTDSVKTYWLGTNGSPNYAPVGGNPSEYPYRDPAGVDYTMYRTRNITSTYSPTLYYVCAPNAASTVVVYQPKPCGQGTNTTYTYEQERFYTCADPNSSSDSPRAMKVNSANAVCNKYSAWSNPTQTQCDTANAGLCQSVTVTFYKWYKLESGTTRTYYPSGATKASGEKVYYIEAPVSNAIKDTSTKTTAYKWYKEINSVTSTYTAVAPSGYATATKTGSSKWSDWSDWTSSNPSTDDGRQREITTKTKIKLQEIKATGNTWENLSNDYVTEEQLIKLFKEKGYEVKTLEDITNNGQIKYQLKMYVRNKKETRK